MRRSSVLLLLSAVALSVCVNAHPYSKIPDSYQLGEGFTSKKSSTGSSSNSFSHENQDNIEINGQHNGQAFAGSKASGYSSNGGTHSSNSAYTSASVSGAIPLALFHKTAPIASYSNSGAHDDTISSQVGYGALQNPGTGSLNLQYDASAAAINSAGTGYDQTAENIGSGHYQVFGVPGSGFSSQQAEHGAHGTHGEHVGGAQYWWMTENSPFAQSGSPASGCSPNGCSSGGSVHVSNQGDGVRIGIQGNPFLQPTSSSGVSGNGVGFGSSASGLSGSGLTFGSASSGATGSGSSGFNFGSGSSGASTSGHHTGPLDSGLAFGSASSGATGSVPSGFSFGSASSGASSSGHHTGPLDSGVAFGSASSGATGSRPSGFSFGSASSGASSSGHQTGSIDVSKNPFLNGAEFSSGSATHGIDSSTVHSSGAQAPAISGGSNSGSVLVQQVPQVQSGAGNPFFQQTPQGQETVFGQQETGAFPGFVSEGQIHHETSGSDGGLSVSCNGQGRICVAKHLCSAAGFVINNDLTQVRTGPQVCDVHSEVCCTLQSSYSDQTSAGTQGGHGTITTTFGTKFDQAGPKEGGIFGNNNNNFDQGLIDYHGGDQELFKHTNQDQDSTGYLPPLGSEPSSNVPAFSKPPVEERRDGDDSSPTNVQPNTIFPPAPAPPPQVGCAAALICVEEQFCTMEGSISPQPVALSSEQILRRVPLSPCKNPDNGVIGYCCRDPNYVDPWPAGNLPANYSGGFDEQGFPTFLNIAKTRPPKKQPPTSGTKGGRPPPIKTSFPNRPQVSLPTKTPNFPQFQNFPNQIPNQFSSTFRPPTGIQQFVSSPAPFPQFPVGSSTTYRPIVPNFPNLSQQPNKPGFPNLPQQPNQPGFPNLSQQPNQPGFEIIPQQPSQPSFPNIAQQPSQQGFPTLPKIPSQPSQPGFPSLPNQQNQPGYPTYTNQENQPGFPSLPRQPTYSGVKGSFPPKNSYDTSSSNENPIVIPPHVPGSQCGIRNNVQRPSGLSDAEVAFGEIPWQAMILLNSEKKLLCSGAIIAPNAIATAARCVEGFNPSQISVKAGEWKLGYELKHEEPLPFEIVNVASIAPYPEYNSGNPANDVALLFLEHDIKLDQHIDMLCLPQGQPQPPQPGQKCISTGWGKTILQVHAAGALMHSIEVDVLSNDQCRQRLDGAETHIDIDGSLVCTKAHRQNNNMCQVDLGGPLACDRGDGYYELVGVYNQDTGCLPTNQVATFAMINTQWVQQMMLHPPRAFIDQSSSQSLALPLPQPQIVHTHGPDEVCDCQKSNLPFENNQYLPPQ